MAHYLGELTESNMKNLQALIDSNSVIGREIVTPDGTVILPVSKVSFGFGGGAGGGVTITPLAFLIVKNGDVKLLQVQSYNNTADRVVGMVPDVVDKVSGLISGSKKEKPAEEE